MMVKTWIEALADAWEMLIEFPLPFLRPGKAAAAGGTEKAALLTQCLFPVIGAICALLAALLGALLNKFLYPLPAAAVFAILLTVFCIGKDRGRGLAGIMFLAAGNSRKISAEHALLNLPDTPGEVNTPLATLTLVLAVLFKLLVFFLMAFSGYIYWLTAVFVLEFALAGDLAALPALEQPQPLLKIKKSKRRHVWFVAGFLVLFVLFKSPVTVLLAAAAAFGFAYLVKTFCESRLGGIDGKIIRLAGYVFELFALLLGLIFLTQGRVILL
ncbi:MAG: hypothetical protein PHH77_04210 [Victivallaceae bacterium]|nr:hypothetical protein [Victivallaceae bacterium]